MTNDQEPDEATIRAGDEALIVALEEIADEHVAHEAEVAERVKHCLQVLHLAGVQLDCVTGDALQRLGESMQAVIHEALSEEP